MEMLSEEFAQLQDHRRANRSYRLADVLRSAFAMFSLKSPSLLSFKEQTKQEEKTYRQSILFNRSPVTRKCGRLSPLSPPRRCVLCSPSYSTN